MKFYNYCVKLLLRYKWFYDWVQTHRIETVDRIFFAGLWCSLIGTGLLFGSGKGFWATLLLIGIVLIVIAKFLVNWAEGKR